MKRHLLKLKPAYMGLLRRRVRNKITIDKKYKLYIGIDGTWIRIKNYNTEKGAVESWRASLPRYKRIKIECPYGWTSYYGS